MGERVPVVVVHGGAGDVPEVRRALHAEGCRRAAEAGLRALVGGASSLEAACVAVEVLEDDPLFNAGTGACLTEEGTLELDASVMEGTTLTAGGVAALSPFVHPIRVADAVRREGRHVLYAAEGAARFARALGFEPVDAGRMITEASRQRLEAVQAGATAAREWAGGTVGAVACDAAGHVAAATSTGGTVGKRVGRVGDTPILGAGTYADDLAGACSTTGVGEQIMRFVLARHAADLCRAGASASAAAEASIAAFGARVSGHGGLILVDPQGGVGVARNTATMSHAIARAGHPSEAGA